MPLLRKPRPKKELAKVKMPKTMAQIIWERHPRNPIWCAENPNAFSARFGSEAPALVRTLFASFCKSLPNDGNLPAIDTLVGIEIECEMVNAGALHSTPLYNWNLKSDGSLRNHGAELVSCAHKVEELPLSLCMALAWLHQKGNPDFSWRTSVHVHLDCSKMLIEDFKKMLLLYFLFEGSLFEFANPGRRDTNIFCTPLTRTNFYVLKDFIHAQEKHSKNAFDALIAVIRKYSALNLAHMLDFGTVEFRHLRGTGNPQFLFRWISLLLLLMKSAQELSKDEIYSNISKLNTSSGYDEFTEKIFGEDLKSLFASPLNSLFLSNGVSLAKELICNSPAIQNHKKSGLSRFVDLKIQQSKKDHLLGKVKPISL